MFHLEEPLHGELRLDGHIGALREAYLIIIVFHFFHQAGLFQVDGNLAAHVEAVHAHVESGGFADGAVVVEDVDGGQVVFLAQHVVVHVVCRSHFQAARTEFDVHVVILNDGDAAVHERHDDFLAFQPRVLRVGGVDAHGRVAHDGFGACGGHHGVASAAVRLPVFSGQHVFQIIEFAVFFLIHYFFVRECRQCFRIPVHHAHTAIDESFVVQVAEHLDDAPAAFFVHGEGRAVPVAAGAQLAELFQDDAAVLVCPLPCVFQELFAR